MEKSLEQFKCIERISRQTRYHRTYLNRVYNQHLCTQLDQLDSQCERNIERSTSRQQLEEKRKLVLSFTVKQIVGERTQKPSLSKDAIQTKQETIQMISKDNKNRTSTSIELPSVGTSCRLFSNNCQLYPCQPVYQYTSFIKKEHDQILRKRNSSIENSPKSPDISRVRNLFTIIESIKHQPDRRHLVSAIQNQHHQVNRHVSMQRQMVRLDEQSRLLHDRLVDKRTFGYVKSRQRQLSQAIQHHLQMTAKFCE